MAASVQQEHMHTGGGMASPLSMLPTEILSNIFARLHEPDKPTLDDHLATKHGAYCHRSAAYVRQVCSWLKTAFDSSNTHLRLGGHGGDPAQGDPSLSALGKQALMAKVQRCLSAHVLATPHLTSLHLPYDSPWLPWSTLMHTCGPALPRLTRLTLWHDQRSDPRRLLNPLHHGALQHSHKRPSLQALTAAASSLTHLDFGGCRRLYGISSLSTLTSLQYLNMRDCTAIRHLAPLSALPRLAHLNISGCMSVEDVSPLSACTSLTHLEMSGCTNAERLCTIPSIVTLTAQQCVFKDLGALSDCSSLTHLDLRECVLPSISALSGCSSITQLNLRSCEEHFDIDALAGCTSLTDLDLGDLSIFGAELSVLSRCSLLSHLNLGSCSELAGISALSACPSLTHLVLQGCCEVTNVRALSACRRLVLLDLSGTSIFTLSGLSGCSSLQHLQLSGCEHLTDISALSGCVSLKHLNLQGCGEVTSVSALSGCVSLQHLNLHLCEDVTGLDALQGLPLALLIVDGRVFEAGDFPPLPSLSHLLVEGDCDDGLQVLPPTLAALTRLHLHDTGLYLPLTPPRTLPLLHLDIKGHFHLPDLDLLARCPLLSTLVLTSCDDLDDLSGLRFCPQLHTLTVSECPQVTCVGALSALTALASLDISQTPIKDLRPLKACSRLTDLKLGGFGRLYGGKPFSLNLQPLTSCRALRKLHVTVPYQCGVKGLHTVADLPLDLEVEFESGGDGGWMNVLLHMIGA